MKFNPLLGVWIVLFSAGTAIWMYAQQNPPPEPMIAIFVVDGLRPDSINATDSPTLARLRSEGAEYTNSHSLFPTVTRLNATALVTGAYPVINGVVGNSMFAAIVNPTAPFDTGDYRQLLKLESAGGRMVTVETLGEILRRNRRKLVTLSSGTTGVGLLLNPYARNGAGTAIHGMFDRGLTAAFPKEASDAIIGRFGAPPESSGEGALMSWTDDVLRDYVLPDLRPDVIIDWMGPLDAAQHASGAGSPQAKSALRRIDESLSKTIAKLNALGRLDRTNIIILSDHGFAQNTMGVSATEALIASGLKKSAESTDIVVASQGQAILFYVAGRDSNVTEKLVRFLQQQEWVDVIFTRDGKDGQGSVSGTFALDWIHAAHAERGADVIVSLAWGSQPNAFGLMGTHSTTATRSGPITTGASGHGGLNPWVVRNTFIGWGPNFKKQAQLDAPVSLADVVPTVLTILGIRTVATDKNHGRVLRELLSNTSPVATTHRVVKTSAGMFEASLEVSTVAGYDYIDAGARKRTPRQREVAVR